MNKQVEDGSVCLADVKFLLESFKDTGEQSLREEITRMSSTSAATWVDKRVKQFQHYQVLFEFCNAASTLLKLQGFFDLHGDFSPLSDIVQAVSTNIVVHESIIPDVILWWCVLECVIIVNTVVMHLEITEIMENASILGTGHN